MPLVKTLIVLACCIAAIPTRSEAPPTPQGPTTADYLSASMAAKRLCSALYVSGRDFEEAIEWSATAWLLPTAMQAYRTGRLKFAADSTGVSASWRDRTLRAEHAGDQGCVILPEGATGVMFNPIEVKSTLPAPDQTEWPMGDLNANASATMLHAQGISRAALEQAVDQAFTEPEDGTAAFLVIHKGKIVAERYAAGAHQGMQLESWSMGKSLTSALVGVLIQQGHLDLDDKLAVPDWHIRANDPRAKITLRHALNMSSGLQITHPADQDLSSSFIPGWADHSIPYGTAVHSFDFCASRPLEFPVGTSGRYRNCDPLLAGAMVKQTLIELGEDYLSWPQKALFDRIGVRQQTLETDVYGNFILTGFDYGTARNWGRLGLLFLNKGNWLGEQIIPEDFVEFVSTAAPAWEDERYGGLFWRKHPSTPPDSYHMNGGGGQQVVIIPSKALVIVRLGHARGFPLFDNREPSARRNKAMRDVIAVIGAS